MNNNIDILDDLHGLLQVIAGETGEEQADAIDNLKDDIIQYQDAVFNTTMLVNDLLEAIKGLLELETRYTKISLTEFDNARAAIAKAEGRE